MLRKLRFRKVLKFIGFYSYFVKSKKIAITKNLIKPDALVDFTAYAYCVRVRVLVEISLCSDSGLPEIDQIVNPFVCSKSFCLAIGGGEKAEISLL